MKKYALFLFLILFVSVYAYEINYFINDYSGVLTQTEIDEIQPILKEIYDSGQAEYAVVIIDSLEGQDIDSFSYNLAEGNLGDSQKDNGLLLLIAMKEQQYKFEVGRGLEPTLPDILVGRIGREHLEPNFKVGDYAKGIIDASIVIQEIFFGNAPEILDESNIQVTDEQFMRFIIFTIIFILIVILLFINSSKTLSKNRKSDDFFTAAWILSQMMKGGKRGGGFSGGSGGFGGGSFGGGGAGGRW